MSPAGAGCEVVLVSWWLDFLRFLLALAFSEVGSCRRFSPSGDCG